MNSAPQVFLDTDQLLLDLFDRKASHDTFSWLESSPSDKALFVKNILTAELNGKIILTNINPERFGLQADKIVVMTPDDYVKRMKTGSRPDLLALGESVLRSWASEVFDSSKVITLNQGENLADVEHLFEPQFSR